MTARQIINALGGVSAVHEFAGVPKTTIYSWGQSDFIPSWRQPKLLELAVRTGVALTTTDFPLPKKKAAA